jgi:hypothetical protein
LRVNMATASYTGENLRIKLLILVVYPTCSHCLMRLATIVPFLQVPPVEIMVILTRQLLLQILKVLVAISIRANQGSGFGITCNTSVPPRSLVSNCTDSRVRKRRTDILLQARSGSISLYSGEEAIEGGGIS